MVAFIFFMGYFRVLQDGREMVRMNLGKSIKVALANRELKNKDLAQMLGLSPSQVSKWISTGRMSIDNQKAICRALGIKPSYFVSLGE